MIKNIQDYLAEINLEVNKTDKSKYLWKKSSKKMNLSITSRVPTQAISMKSSAILRFLQAFGTICAEKIVSRYQIFIYELYD